MNVINRTILARLNHKNMGNARLTNAIEKLIKDLEDNDFDDHNSLRAVRPDADKVHSSGVYFFDLNVHRTMVVVKFDENVAKIIWAGNHEAYEKTFKNNKNTIEKWLIANDFI